MDEERYPVYCPWCDAEVGTAQKVGGDIQTFIDGPDCRHDWTVLVLVQTQRN